MPLNRMDDLTDDVRIQVPSAIDQYIQNAIERCTLQFCHDTWAYQNTYYRNADEGIQEYLIVPENEDTLIAIQGVEYRGKALAPVRPTQVPSGRIGTPMGWSYTPTNMVQIYPAPDRFGPQALEFRLVLAPAKNFLPDVLFTQHHRGLLTGAMAWLYAMPEQRWTSPQLAMEYKREHASHVREAKRRQLFEYAPRNHTMRSGGGLWP